MRRPRYYILNDEHRPVLERDVIRWSVWFEESYRTVDYTQITSALIVSTVFLGIDHRFFGDGPPILFETMVFEHGDTVDCVRYSSWDDAATGHKAMVRRLRKEPGASRRR